MGIAPLQGKASAHCGPEVGPLLEQCYLGLFWTFRRILDYGNMLSPAWAGVSLPLVNGGQSADTTMKTEGVDSAASLSRGKESSAQTRGASAALFHTHQISGFFP